MLAVLFIGLILDHEVSAITLHHTTAVRALEHRATQDLNRYIQACTPELSYITRARTLRRFLKPPAGY